MMLSWSGRRQLLYTAVAVVLGLVVLFGVYRGFFTTIPTCDDGAQNGRESGVDCGGSCQRICQSESRAPVVLWARSFRTGEQTYTAAAYVQNQNTGAYAPDLRYTFQLFDENNLLVVERTGVTLLPPVQVVPIIELSIDVGHRTVARTLFSFTRDPVWLRARDGEFAAVRAAAPVLAHDGSTLSATLVNDSRFETTARVAAVLFDAQGIAQAASLTTLPIGRRSQEPVFFTWPGGVSGVIRAEVIALPLAR